MKARIDISLISVALYCEHSMNPSGATVSFALGLMAYSHCQIRTRIPTQTWIFILCRNFTLVQIRTDALVEMYGIGMDICPRDRYLSLKWVK